MTHPSELHAAVATAMGDVLVGNEDVTESLTVALLTRGHVLLEGVPGVAKTTIARTFARASGLSVNRIQMTPDVLPADITGTYVYREPTGEFELRKGPIFANIVIADEINRATPKTQSALLEAMQERQVTIEGDTRSMLEPFMLVATQNPVEMEGTFELPVAQRDRFQQKVTVEMPDRDTEQELLERFAMEPDIQPDAVEAVVNPETVRSARDYVASVHLEDAVQSYILDLIVATRDHTDIRHGASPRTSIALQHTSQAVAALADRDYVIPDDVKSAVPTVIPHRLVLETEAELSDITPYEIVEDILDDVPPPGSEAVSTPAHGPSRS